MMSIHSQNRKKPQNMYDKRKETIHKQDDDNRIDEPHRG